MAIASHEQRHGHLLQTTSISMDGQVSGLVTKTLLDLPLVLKEVLSFIDKTDVPKKQREEAKKPSECFLANRQWLAPSIQGFLSR
ncbi:hypothetical protein [Pseudomonas sp. SDO55104_S430]